MKTQEETDPRWTPVRRGHIYCSPACGGKCTWANYQKAVKDSAALAKSLGKGWTTNVTENLGWHWDVQSPCGHLRVSGPYACRDENSFHAFVGDVGDWGTGDFSEHGNTPKEAMRKVIRTAKRAASRLVSMTKDL